MDPSTSVDMRHDLGGCLGVFKIVLFRELLGPANILAIACVIGFAHFGLTSTFMIEPQALHLYP